MESKGDFWMDMHASASILRGLPAAPDLENQGSGDFSSHDGSLPSCSSSSSERNSSTNLVDEAAEVITVLEDCEVRAMLKDADVRAMLRKVTINEDMLNKTIQSLGGGEKGLQSLMEYIMLWVKQQRDIESSSHQPTPFPPSNPAWNFSTAQNMDLQPGSDAFQILGGILQSPPTTRLLDQEMRHTRRSKYRKLMTGEPEMGAEHGGLDTGVCPSGFIRSREDCKPEVTSPDIPTPCNPHLNHGMQQQPQTVTPCTRAHIAMPSAESTPAKTTKAARRHRMARQRQSFRARAGSPDAIAPVSIGGGSSWNTNAATPPAVKSTGMSGAQTTPPSAPVIAAREVLRGIKKKNVRLGIEPVRMELGYSSAKGSLDGQPSLHENGAVVQRLYGGNPSNESEEEPVNLDDDLFLDELILSMGPSFESDSSSIQTMEQFPSLSLDFPFEEMMAVTRTEPEGT